MAEVMGFRVVDVRGPHAPLAPLQVDEEQGDSDAGGSNVGGAEAGAERRQWGRQVRRGGVLGSSGRTGEELDAGGVRTLEPVRGGAGTSSVSGDSKTPTASTSVHATPGGGAR